MNLFDRLLRRSPAIEVITPDSDLEAPDSEQFPSGDPAPITRESIARSVQVAYSDLSESDRTRMQEDMYSRFEFDTPYSRGTTENLGTPGRFTLLREWYWTERMDVLERSHQAWERNPLAKAGVSWTTRFVIGTGGTLTYKAAEVKEVIEEYINDPINSFQAYEREFCDALQVDGELWLRQFESGQGRLNHIPMRPWHVQWITTDEHNYKKVISYHYVYVIYKDQPGQSEIGIVDVPVEEVLHVAINRLPYELRGRPDLFVILPWLKAARDFLEERARIHRRMSVYYHVTLKNAQSGQVASYQAKFSKPPAPGSIIVTNENVIWEVLESKIRAGDAAEDGRQIKLMALAGMQLPEYFFSDGANANLASATAQQLPALRKFSDYQDILTDQVWKPIFKRVICAAVKAGRISGTVIPDVDDDCMLDMIDSNGDPVMDDAQQQAPKQTVQKVAASSATVSTIASFSDGGGIPVKVNAPQGKVKQIKASEAFDYAYPNLEEKDPYNLAKALQIALGLELVSEETASTEMGYDYPKERKNIVSEGAKRLERAMQTPKGFNPDGTPLPPKDMATLAQAQNPNAKSSGQAK